jgi:predicted phosphodiesterase
MAVCKKCQSTSVKKDGTKARDTYRVQQYRCKECNHQWVERIESAIIQGITAEEHVSFDQDIMPYLKKIGERAKLKTEAEVNQIITLPNRPFAIAILSDIHGGGKCDYEAIERDVNIIAETEDMYVGNLGDDTDNFVNTKLQWIQKAQPTTFDMEIRFLEWLFTKLSGSVLFWVSGNHNNWTAKASGVDFIREGLKGTHCLYDSAQIFFTLKWGDNEQKWLVRHKWKHSSIFNPTHCIEVGWERVGLNFDVGCAGHTHIATLCRPFIREGKKRYAVLLSTYKIRDNFGKECGYASPVGNGSGAFIYHPDGRSFWCEDLSIARDLLKMWKDDYVQPE